MSLTPPRPRDPAHCCSRCTRRPHLDGCSNAACACHTGAPRTKPATPAPAHTCRAENCKECLPDE